MNWSGYFGVVIGSLLALVVLRATIYAAGKILSEFRDFHGW